MTQGHPNFVVLGAPKCGTMSLYDFFVRHPDTHVAPKEPHFFGSDLEFTSPRMTFVDYMSLFEGSAGRATGDVSVSYLLSERAPNEIYAHNPKAKLIAMLRNPVDLIYSMHGQALYNKDEDESDLRRALALEPDRIDGRQRAKNPFAIHATYYRRTARLGTQLARYREVFPTEQVHAIVLDDLKGAPNRTLASLCDFIEISTPSDLHLAHKNAYRAQRFPRVEAAIKYGSRRIVPRTPLPRLPRSVKDKMIAVRQQLRHTNTTMPPREPMDPELRERLTIEFVPEVEKLEMLLGRDLSSWKTADART